MKEHGNKRRIRDKGSHQATVVGNGSVIKGDLGGKDDYIIFGRVEGNADIEGALMVEASAQWDGDISATHIVIAGRVQGNVRARDGLELAATARVTGNVSGGRVAIAEGAVLDGEISMRTSEKIARFEEKRKS